MPAECDISNSSDSIEALASAPSVEVSGWDAEGQFFIEIADLDLDASGDTAVRLCHRVPSGSLVFVRLLHGGTDDVYEKSCPTAHEAHAAEPPDFTGRSRVRLIPCQPRVARQRGDRNGATRI